MRRRDFITLIGGAWASWPFAAQAQQLEKVARVGFLRQVGPHAKQFDAFRDGLRAAGYIEGQNVLIEQRYAAGAYERLSGLATELLRANVDVIVVDGTVAANACKGRECYNTRCFRARGRPGRRWARCKFRAPRRQPYRPHHDGGLWARWKAGRAA
jgi:putative tryptophan/tyrosine transport system substrate-binding protein